MCLKAMARNACRRSRKRLPHPADLASETFDNTRVHAVTVPTTLAQAPVDVILVARTGTAPGFSVERLNLGAMPRVRLVVVAQNGSERASAWATTQARAPLAVAVSLSSAAATSRQPMGRRICARPSLYPHLPPFRRRGTPDFLRDFWRVGQIATARADS